MILVCGIPSEPPVSLVLESAAEIGVECTVFNQRNSHYNDIFVKVDDDLTEASIRIQERFYSLNEFTGTYNRMMDWQHIPENEIIKNIPMFDTRLRKSAVIHETLGQWFEITCKRIMNRNSAMASNMSKPYQAQFIRSVGFLTPDTLITTNPDYVRAFLARHKRVIFKSTSSIRSIVKELDDAYLNAIDRIRYLPTQFQAYVSGTDIRVHVAGYDIYATKIVSEAVDYRYAQKDSLDVEMQSIELPEDIANRCRQLAVTLRLPLCGIDLRLDDANQYYCFEVNPSPGYSYYQGHTGQPISNSIVKYLANLR